MPELDVSGIRLRYGAVEVLKGASFAIERGEVAALLGPSGSGKTTLLRAVAGLERPEGGRIAIAGRPVFDAAAGLDVPTDRRGLGFVFQSYALWPHRSVFDNVAYGLRLRRRPDAEVRRGVGAALDALGLGPFAARFPHQLSGGQQQRVAIARSLAYEPAVLLLDEPLSNLDARLRDDARGFLKELIKREGRSAVIVTHDQVEALAIADTIVLLNAGEVEQHGAPQALYDEPASLFAAEFMGANARVDGAIAALSDGIARLAVPGGTVAGRLRTPKGVGAPASAICRLEHVGLAGAGSGRGGGEGAGPDGLAMTRVTSMFLGERWEHVFRAEATTLRVHTPGPLAGDAATVRLPPDKTWIY